MAFGMVQAFVLVRMGSSESLNFMKSVKEKICAVKGVKEVMVCLGMWIL